MNQVGTPLPVVSALNCCRRVRVSEASGRIAITSGINVPDAKPQVSTAAKLDRVPGTHNGITSLSQFLRANRVVQSHQILMIRNSPLPGKNPGIENDSIVLALS
jgi:hypothetical protein